MHSEATNLAKEMVELDVTLNVERQTSFLEEDLALSSSTHDSLAEKTLTESEKTRDEESTRQSSSQSLTQTTESSLSQAQQQQPPQQEQPQQAPVIYVSEDAMDCPYDDSSNLSRHFELQEAPSPELFESDEDEEADDEAESTASTFPKLDEIRPSLPSPKRLTPAELTTRADKLLLRHINKYLTGVPPPPSHTISQKDCDDFLVYIKQNRQYFWADPFKLDEKPESEVPDSKTPLVADVTPSASQQEPNQDKSEDVNTSSTSSTSVNSTNKVFHTGKPGLRNLSTAFDACEQSSYLKVDNNDSLAVDAESTDTTSSFSLSDTLLTQSSVLSVSTFTPLSEDSKLNDSNNKEMPSLLYRSIAIDEAPKLTWPDAYKHRCHEIYYNRNRAVEEFENLRIKFSDRYVGAETQSTCNVWFCKQIPGSARKRSLLAKRNNGQSPGKRLSYLARRRRTFSSANLQGLGLIEKKQLMLNVKRGLIRKGKSPRGKSPRGKSPRGKTPRSSAKKRQLRRLLFEGPSPRKTKIETSKRALFQSPPADRPGPSRATATATVTSNNNNNNPQRIKRALFSTTPKKSEAGESSQTQSLTYPDSRKRKSEEDLENPKQKWAKSLSFDCSRNLENSSSNACNLARHSTSGNLSKDGTSNYGKCELSETHRKKLLWAVAEALRAKGIGMSHPQFKQYAACLARTVRKYMPDLENKNVPRKPGSTSDRMLKLAKRHVLLIVESKTAL